MGSGNENGIRSAFPSLFSACDACYDSDDQVSWIPIISQCWNEFLCFYKHQECLTKLILFSSVLCKLLGWEVKKG